MKFSFTQDQIDKLNKAIDLAEEFGACLYTQDGKPCCVIAQLASLEGINVKRFDVGLKPIDAYLRLGRFKELDVYPREFLVGLQNIWDSKQIYKTEDNARAAMRQFVKETMT